MEKIKKNIEGWLLGVVAVAVALIWYAVFFVEKHRQFSITFFDIGQGDAIFIETPNANQVLIDGGPGDRILAKLGHALPFWDRSIDLLILTHPHADHLDGLLAVLKRYDIGMVLETGVSHSIPEYSEWHEFLKRRNVPVTSAHRGQRVWLSGSAYLDIFAPFEDFEGEAPKNIHDAMVVAKLIHASTTVLLTGDAEKPLEYRLLFSGTDLRADILKIGHHGSKTSTAEEFLRAVGPKVAVISVGRKNRYGHPHQDVLGRLWQFGITLFRTDTDGDVSLVSDGKTWRNR